MTPPVVGFHTPQPPELEEQDTAGEASWWQGRKFLLAAVILVTGGLLAAFKILTGEYVTLAGVVMTAFSAADTLITRKALGTNQ